MIDRRSAVGSQQGSQTEWLPVQRQSTQAPGARKQPRELATQQAPEGRESGVFLHAELAARDGVGLLGEVVGEREAGGFGNEGFDVAGVGDVTVHEIESDPINNYYIARK